MGKIVDWIGDNFFELSVTAVALIIIGAIFNIPFVMLIGISFFGFFAFILLFGLILSFLYDLIPEFKGKSILMGMLSIVIGSIMLATVLMSGKGNGSGEEELGEEGSGFMYRGVRE